MEWIERDKTKELFKKLLLGLENQVLILRGARQVGKSSFILKVLSELEEYQSLKINFLYPSEINIFDTLYFGRDFFGNDASGIEFIKNIKNKFPNLERPIIIFIDEADAFPKCLESIQTLASYSFKFKFILTGSNLENLPVDNAATGRKLYFDLYPITFSEFLIKSKKERLSKIVEEILFDVITEYDHQELLRMHEVYMRLGGMPKILSTYFNSFNGSGSESKNEDEISRIVKDLSFSIEENVKSVLGEKIKYYEYHEVLKTIAKLSLNTLKFSKLQVNHAGRNEAKKIVFKTVGARVAHKVSLWDSESDLSKYIIFDSGITNNLIAGSNILSNNFTDKNLGIMYETVLGNSIISSLNSREDLFYWKSGNLAEIEYLLHSPFLVAIDVKAKSGKSKSLSSFALNESAAKVLVKITSELPKINKKHIAKLSTSKVTREIPLITLPHYFGGKIKDIVQNCL